jgi:hypothetical protein
MFPYSYNLCKMFNTYYFMLAFALFFMCRSKPSNQIGCFEELYSALINLLMFCLRATLLSASFYTIWGTICYKETFGMWIIY